MNEQSDSDARPQIDVDLAERAFKEIAKKITPSPEELTVIYEQALFFGGVLVHVSFGEGLELRTRLISQEEFSRLYPPRLNAQISPMEGEA